MKQTVNRVPATEQKRRSDDLIRCEGVWKVYNEGRPHEVRALEDVSFSIRRGSFVSIHGPSGSGKTTLISVIGTIERPGRGNIIMDGRDISGFSDMALSSLRRRRIGFVFQDYNLIPGLRAWENVSAPLIPAGAGKRERRDRAAALLETLGLSGRMEHSAEEMSGGERQRVAIARALVNNPDIVILDEPASNIDRENTEALIHLLKALNAEGRTIIVSTHEDDLSAGADVTYELQKGKISGTRKKYHGDFSH